MNEHAKEARRYVYQLAEMPEQVDVPASAITEALLAIAYELRTANLIEFQPSVESTSDLDGTIRDRLDLR